jgi:hypothetical protein
MSRFEGKKFDSQVMVQYAELNEEWPAVRMVEDFRVNGIPEQA